MKRIKYIIEDENSHKKELPETLKNKQEDYIDLARTYSTDKPFIKLSMYMYGVDGNISAIIPIKQFKYGQSV